MWTYILLLIISALVLIKAGGLAVKSLSKIALFLNWSEFTTAFLLMAVTTSLPELFVGISAAIHGTPELSFGNIIGSNIINLTLVVALTLIFVKNIKAESATVRKTAVFTVLIVFLPFILMFDKVLSRIDAFVLFAVLGIYLYSLIKKRAKFKKVLDYTPKKDWVVFKVFFKHIGLFALSVLLLIASAEGIVRSALFLATGWGVSLLTIGIILVALGTNLPEIVFGIKAVSLGHKDMILGNLIDRKSTRLNSSHIPLSRMPSSA